MAIIPKSRAIIWRCLLANAVLLLFYVSRNLPGDLEMESLAAFVVDTGHATWVPAISLSYVGLPYDDLTFYELRAESESGKTRQSSRYRKTAKVDIFLLDFLPHTNAGYFYSTNTHSRLIKSVYLDERPEDVSDADERLTTNWASGNTGRVRNWSGRKQLPRQEGKAK